MSEIVIEPAIVRISEPYTGWLSMIDIKPAVGNLAVVLGRLGATERTPSRFDRRSV